MYNGALDDMGLTTSPWTNNRYSFTGGNPISRIEIDGHYFAENGGDGKAVENNYTGFTRITGASNPKDKGYFITPGDGILNVNVYLSIAQ